MRCSPLTILNAYPDSFVILPSAPSSTISRQGEGKKRQRVFVRKPDPNLLWQLRDTEGVNDVEVNTPSLEDIFVAYLDSEVQQLARSEAHSSSTSGAVGESDLQKGSA